MSRDRRDTLRALFDAAVAAAHPDGCLPPHLPEPPAGRIVVLAAGKAAGSMAAAAERHYLDALSLPPDRLTGLAIARYGYGRPTRRIRMVEASHPVPDEAGIAATGQALERAASAGPDDLVLVLLSGGGSALWIAPANGVTLEAKQELTRALLASGARIGEINTVRRHLSRIKGGRLAAAAYPARLLTLAISDVAGNDPAAIASGPTVADPTSLADARAVLDKYAITPGPEIAAALSDPANETPKPADSRLANATYRLVATPAMAIAAADREARALGFETEILGSDLEDDARDLAGDHAELARKRADQGRKVAILSGGEATVTLRGRGRGGPNQEFALALAIALHGRPGIWGLAGDTDGTDGGKGAADDPAGAIIGPDTLPRATQLGLDADAFLEDNDSTGFFERLGDLLVPGPTFTNVNDFRAVIVDTDAD
ncbi:glycerate kinase type-2 family protein [Microbaculum sp. FT89]|uniref:glycerate kinase type-2 family protein n=1 Tax=Microbaculum sp. FT89 TaxID=3447298 RepID=UPI003F52AE85